MFSKNNIYLKPVKSKKQLFYLSSWFLAGISKRLSSLKQLFLSSACLYVFYILFPTMWQRLYQRFEKTVKDLFSAFPKPVQRLFLFVYSLGEKIFLFSILLDIYLLSFVFYTRVGFALYTFSFILFIGDPGVKHPPLVYVLLVSFFLYTSSTLLYIWLLFRVPKINEFLTDRLGEDFIKRKICNPLKKAVNNTAIMGAAVLVVNAIDSHINDYIFNNRVRELHETIDHLRDLDPPVEKPEFEKVVNEIIREGPPPTAFSRFAEAAVYAFGGSKLEDSKVETGGKR